MLASYAVANIQGVPPALEKNIYPTAFRITPRLAGLCTACVCKNVAKGIAAASARHAHAEMGYPMNTDRKAITRAICQECGEVFEIVGTTPIRLAFPRPPTTNPNTGLDQTGVCPKHPRKVSNAE